MVIGTIASSGHHYDMNSHIESPPPICTWEKWHLGGYGTLSTEFLSDCHHDSIIMLNVCCVCGMSGQYVSVGLDQKTKTGSCLFQCDVPHQWIAQRQVYCDVMGCPVSAAWHSSVAALRSKYHCYKLLSQYDLRC